MIQMTQDQTNLVQAILEELRFLTPEETDQMFDSFREELREMES